MPAPPIASLWACLLLFVPVLPLFACDVPPEFLAGRTVPEIRQILKGEIVFVADAQLHDFEGQTTAVSGVVMTRELEDAVGCVAIEAKSLDTGIDRRNRLMWEDHLEVAQFPEIQFILTGLGGVHRDGEKVTVTLEGKLTLHGITQNVRVPVSISPMNGRFEVEGKTALTMSDYAIERPAFLFIRVKDEVDVRFRVLVGAAE